MSTFLYSVYALKNINDGLHLLVYAFFLTQNKVSLKPGEPFEGV